MSQNAIALGGQFITFKVGEETFGVEILKTQEIINLSEVTSMPHLPSFISGVTELRNTALPVIDLRIRFAEKYDYRNTENTCIIVIKYEDKNIGMIVDAVSEVLTITPNMIEPAPFFVNNNSSNAFIGGIGKVNNELIILVDTNKILSETEFEATTHISGDMKALESDAENFINEQMKRVEAKLKEQKIEEGKAKKKAASKKAASKKVAKKKESSAKDIKENKEVKEEKPKKKTSAKKTAAKKASPKKAGKKTVKKEEPKAEES